MTSCPLVSIIIDNYNYARFLAKAIESSIGQTYSPVEVIVVDDGSTDNSRSVIETFSDKVIPIYKENGKQASALNAGFEASNGEIIIFLDSDDYLFEEAVDNIITSFQTDIGKVHYRLEVVDENNNSLGYFIPSVGMELTSGDVRSRLIGTSSYVSSPMSGNAYRRETIAPIFPIPSEYSSTADDYLMISTPFYAGGIASIDEPIGAYRVHDSNQWALTEISASRFRRFVNHDLQNFALLKRRAGENKLIVPDDIERRSLGRIWSRMASLRLEPELHPVESDRIHVLTWWGMTALWKYSNHNFQKKIIYTIFFLIVGGMPRPISRLGITWLYAPHLRPKLIDTTINKMRELLN